MDFSSLPNDSKPFCFTKDFLLNTVPDAIINILLFGIILAKIFPVPHGISVKYWLVLLGAGASIPARLIFRIIPIVFFNLRERLYQNEEDRAYEYGDEFCGYAGESPADFCFRMFADSLFECKRLYSDSICMYHNPPKWSLRRPENSELFVKRYSRYPLLPKISAFRRNKPLTEVYITPLDPEPLVDAHSAAKDFDALYEANWLLCFIGELSQELIKEGLEPSERNLKTRILRYTCIYETPNAAIATAILKDLKFREKFI